MGVEGSSAGLAEEFTTIDCGTVFVALVKDVGKVVVLLIKAVEEEVDLFNDIISSVFESVDILNGD